MIRDKKSTEISNMKIDKKKKIEDDRNKCCLYYRDSSASEDLNDYVYAMFDNEEDRQKEYDRIDKEIKSNFGELCSGDEDLYIEFDKREKGIIVVGKSKYKLIK